MCEEHMYKLSLSFAIVIYDMCRKHILSLFLFNRKTKTFRPHKCLQKSGL